VALPAEEVPTELPEPALGINFARDGMNRRDWLALVAVHSDSWLLSVAFYYAARLNRNDRYAAPRPIPTALLLPSWCFSWDLMLVLCLHDPVMEFSEASVVPPFHILQKKIECSISQWTSWDFGVCGQFVDLIVR
jgi:hypothetical protein